VQNLMGEEMTKAKIEQYISAEKLLRVALVPVVAVACRSAGISQRTFFRWRGLIDQLNYDAPILHGIDRGGSKPIYIKAYCTKCGGLIAKAISKFDGDMQIFDSKALRCVYCNTKIYRGFWARLLGW